MLLTETLGLHLGLGASRSFLVADSMEIKVGEEGESLLGGNTRGRLDSSLMVSSLRVEGVVGAA